MAIRTHSSEFHRQVKQGHTASQNLGQVTNFCEHFKLLKVTKLIMLQHVEWKMLELIHIKVVNSTNFIR